MRSALKMLGLAGVLSIAFLAGRSASSRGDASIAYAGPTWDASRSTWVESAGGALVMWRMDGEKVGEVTVHYLSTEPAVYEVKAPAADGKPAQPVEKFPAGDYVFTRTYKPAPAGMPEPASNPLWRGAGGGADAAARLRGAPPPMPAPAAPAGGVKACGQGKCG